MLPALRCTLYFPLLAGISLALAAASIIGLKHDFPPAEHITPEPPMKTVEQRVEEFGADVDARLAPVFRAKGISYPPCQLVLVGLKQEKRLELYGADETGPLRFIRSYPVLAASGEAGPKLREGDRQVPEGIYGIELLNPNSAFHLSLRVNYPNAFDREQAQREGRTNLGGDIMIHGDAVSAGCLAMGDPAAEDLFILAARMGLKNIRVLLCPSDFRKGEVHTDIQQLPVWASALYDDLRRDLAALPLPE